MRARIASTSAPSSTISRGPVARTSWCTAPDATSRTSAASWDTGRSTARRSPIPVATTNATSTAAITVATAMRKATAASAPAAASRRCASSVVSRVAVVARTWSNRILPRSADGWHGSAVEHRLRVVGPPGRHGRHDRLQLRAEVAQPARGQRAQLGHGVPFVLHPGEVGLQELRPAGRGEPAHPALLVDQRHRQPLPGEQPRGAHLRGHRCAPSPAARGRSRRTRARAARSPRSPRRRR